MKTIAVLGAGSWGTALAVHLNRAGHDVRLWARDETVAAELTSRRVNAAYLPDVDIPTDVLVTAALDEAITAAHVVVSTVPSHGVRSVWRGLRSHIGEAVVVSATKGLEGESLLRMSEVIGQELDDGRPVAVLSGPSFATEVAARRPTAVCVACRDAKVAAQVQEDFRTPYFRLYATADVPGVELGGSLKNVIAIAAGVVEGLQLGHNALAALITRGLVEMTRVACTAGAERETLAGLTGLGDLVLTCTGQLSRNRHVGIQLSRGRALADILSEMKMVPEGVNTTRAALALGHRHQVELPIAEQMDAVLAGRCTASEAVEALMLRRQRAEAEEA